MVTYILIVYILGIVANAVYAAQGGTYMEPGHLIFGAIWSTVTLFLILNFGVPEVL